MSLGTGLQDPQCTSCEADFDDRNGIYYHGNWQVLCKTCFDAAVAKDADEYTNKETTNKKTDDNKVAIEDSKNDGSVSAASQSLTDSQNQKPFKRLKTNMQITVDCDSD